MLCLQGQYKMCGLSVQIILESRQIELTSSTKNSLGEQKTCHSQSHHQ